MPPARVLPVASGGNGSNRQGESDEAAALRAENEAQRARVAALEAETTVGLKALVTFDRIVASFWYSLLQVGALFSRAFESRRPA